MPYEIERKCQREHISPLNLREIAPGIELTEDGWWASHTLSDIAYPEEGNSVCFAVEDSSFWFQHRNRCIVEVLRRFPPAGAFFDIGGGNGCVARAIQDAGHEVVLVEPGIRGVENAHLRGIHHIVRATLEDMRIQAATLPAVGLFDVVEHISDDAGFLANIHRFLAPGGRVYITVPAYNLLWSHEDILAGHFRRYTLGSIRSLLENRGYAIDFATYFFSFLAIPIFFGRVVPYRFGFGAHAVSEQAVRSSHSAGNPITSGVVERLSRAELSRIARLRPLRWGGSCLVAARKI